MPIALGTRSSSYEITALLGAGGMAEVYKARDTQLERDVAIKVLPPGLAALHERGSVRRAGRALRITAQVIWNLGHGGG